MLSLWNERKMTVFLVVSKRVMNPSFQRECEHHIEAENHRHIESTIRCHHIEKTDHGGHFKTRVLSVINLK